MSTATALSRATEALALRGYTVHIRESFGRILWEIYDGSRPVVGCVAETPGEAFAEALEQIAELHAHAASA